MSKKLTLEKTIIITKVHKSSVPFWSNTRPGDHITISTYIGGIGKYAQYYDLKNDRTRMKDTSSGGILSNMLNKLGYTEEG